jgi:15-cis-phytoene synthase
VESTEQGAAGEQLETAAVADLVRARSLERYWSALFAPLPERPPLLALYAFSAELDHIAAAVREPMVAQIRLQWWRNAIELAEPGMKTGNPVADALSGVILSFDVPKERLSGMIDVRTAEVVGNPPAGMEGLRASLVEADGTVFELAASVLGDASEAAKEAAVHAGIAWGLTQRLCTFSVQAARRRLRLPLAHLESRGADPAWIYSGRSSAGLLAGLADFRAEADRSLRRVRELAPKCGRAAWPAFLPLAVVPSYLKAMAAPSFDPLHKTATLNPLHQYWRILRAALLRSI